MCFNDFMSEGNDENPLGSAFAPKEYPLEDPTRQALKEALEEYNFGSFSNEKEKMDAYIKIFTLFSARFLDRNVHHLRNEESKDRWIFSTSNNIRGIQYILIKGFENRYQVRLEMDKAAPESYVKIEGKNKNDYRFLLEVDYGVGADSKSYVHPRYTNIGRTELERVRIGDESTVEESILTMDTEEFKRTEEGGWPIWMESFSASMNDIHKIRPEFENFSLKLNELFQYGVDGKPPELKEGAEQGGV